jgi:carboxypeptidase T
MRRGVVLAALFTTALLGASSGAEAATARFPRGDAAYHTYGEVSSELRAIAAAHPDIARLGTIGTSYQGRQLWRLKISDNVAVDENEPEVLITGLTHAREHLTVEQSLAIIHWLVDGYGNTPRITNIVNSSEVWVVPMLNPDGGEWDIRNGRYHAWRKNRQPTPRTHAVGTDINRNFGYRWGCCGGASPDPFDITFRGPRRFSTPEAAAERDFVNSRIVGGRQQIKLSLSFHSFGAQILFPYGYTRRRLPADMVPRDRSAMRALAAGIAARNGYRPLQESHLYITSGTFNDWDYGHAGILSFTIELAPRTRAQGGFYPSGARIGALTGHNRSALLWFLEQAPCPYDAAGITAQCASAAPQLSILALALSRAEWIWRWVPPASPPLAS